MSGILPRPVIPPIPPSDTDSTSQREPSQWVVNLGELARPFAIAVVSVGVGYCIVTRDAIAIGAAGAVLSSLYLSKTYENSVQARASASVAAAQGTGK